VARYKDRIQYWEVWNEPDACYADPAAREGSGQEYYRICRAAHDAARGADPEAKLVVGVMCHPLEVGARYDIFPDAFSAGLRKYLDVFSYHHYSILAGDSGRTRDQLRKMIHGIRRLLGEAETRTTPVWNSEQGVESEDPHFGSSACYPFVFGASKVPVEAAVAGVVTGHVACLAEGVEKVFAYAFMPQSRMLHPDGCPLSPFTYDNLPKPWLAARAILATLLEGASYRSELKLHDRLECHLFDTPKGMLAVLWGYTKRPDTRLRADESAPLRGAWLDVMGNPVDGESIRIEGLPIGHQPVYCLFPAGDRPAWEGNLARAKLRGLLPPPLEDRWSELGVACPPGWKGEVARVEPVELGPLASGYVMTGDGDELACYLWAIAGQDRGTLDSVDLLPSERVVAAQGRTPAGEGIPLLRQGAWILSSSAETDTHDLRRRVEKGTLTGWEPLAMTARALPDEHGQPVILLDILSQWNRPLALESVRASVSSPVSLKEDGLSKGGFALAPGASRPFTLRLRDWPPASCEGSLSLATRISGQKALTLSAPLRIAVAKRTGKPIVIDGVPDEQWGDSRPVHIGTRSQARVGAENWGGVGDCSGAIRFLWDRRRLYALVEVADDVILPSANKQLWKGDAAELFFALNPWTNRHQTSYTDDHSQFLFAPAGKDGTPGPRWTGSAGHGEGARDTNVPQVASSADGNGWTMEIAIPWRHMRGAYSPQAGEVMGMDVAIDDVDKDLATRIQAVWNGTKDNYRDPSHFGLLVLRE